MGVLDGHGPDRSLLATYVFIHWGRKVQIRRTGRKSLGSAHDKSGGSALAMRRRQGQFSGRRRVRSIRIPQLGRQVLRGFQYRRVATIRQPDRCRLISWLSRILVRVAAALLLPWHHLTRSVCGGYLVGRADGCEQPWLIGLTRDSAMTVGCLGFLAEGRLSKSLWPRYCQHCQI